MIIIASPMIIQLPRRCVKITLEAIISIAYPRCMADDQPKKKNPLGLTGEIVANNVKRIRQVRRLAYTELAVLLDGLGRPIPTLGLRNIEAHKRRVDSDDLVALAVALGVSPAALLMPPSETAEDLVSMTAVPETTANRAWIWLGGRMPLSEDQDIPDFVVPGWPRWLWLEVSDKVNEAIAEFQRRTPGGGKPTDRFAVSFDSMDVTVRPSVEIDHGDDQ